MLVSSHFEVIDVGFERGWRQGSAATSDHSEERASVSLGRRDHGQRHGYRPPRAISLWRSHQICAIERSTPTSKIGSLYWWCPLTSSKSDPQVNHQVRAVMAGSSSRPIESAPARWWRSGTRSSCSLISSRVGIAGPSGSVLDRHTNQVWWVLKQRQTQAWSCAWSGRDPTITTPCHRWFLAYSGRGKSAQCASATPGITR